MQYKNKMEIFTLLALISSIAFSACTSTPKSDVSSLSDISNIVEWWEGDFDNNKQIDNLKFDGAPVWQKDIEGQKLGGHLPVTAYYRRIDLPEFGETVIYVEEKTFGPEGNPYRQRLYTLTHDEASDAISVKMWSFKDKKKYLGAWKNLNLVAKVTPEDMSPLPDNCDLEITRLEDLRYHMKMPKGACVFGSKLFDYQVVLGPNSYWFRDRIANSETGVVESTAGGFTYHQLSKMTPN